MKFCIVKSEIKKILKTANEVCCTTTNPLTDAIKIAIDKENNCIYSYFFNHSIKVELKLEDDSKFQIEESGIFIVNLKLLDNIISKLDEGMITFHHIDTNCMTIEQNQFSSFIYLIDPKLYIDIIFSKLEDAITFTLPTHIFKDIKDKICQCSAQKESSATIELSNYNFNNVFLLTDIEKRKLNVFTTDSYRIARICIDNFDTELNSVFEMNFVNFIVNNIDEEKITIEKNKKYMFCNTKNLKILYKNNDDSIPMILDALFDNDIFTSAKINAKTLYNVVDRCCSIANNEKVPIMTIVKESDELKISLNSIATGSVNETVKLLETDDKKIELNVNSKLLTPILKAFGDNEIRIDWIKKIRYDNFEENRLVFTDLKDQNFKQLILPMRS